MKDCHIHYYLALEDGVCADFTSKKEHYRPSGRIVVQTVTDASLEKARQEYPPDRKTKSLVTYRYWNAVHGIVLEQYFEMIHDLGFDLPKAAGYLRETAKRIEELEVEGVDADAAAAAKAYAGLLREMVKVYSSRSGARLLVGLGELVRLKADTFTKMADENQQMAGKSEDLFQFLHSRRKALEKRHKFQLPPLVPPVQAALTPYTLGGGYYVLLLNVSGDDIKNVEVRYRDAEGAIRHQDVAKRLTFNAAESAFQALLLDPSKKKWRVQAGEWITILYDGGAYSYPTDRLMKK